MRILGINAMLQAPAATRGRGVTHCPEAVAHHHPAPSPRTGRSATGRRRAALLTASLRRSPPNALARTLDAAAVGATI